MNAKFGWTGLDDANAYVIFEPGIITCVNFFRYNICGCVCVCVDVGGDGGGGGIRKSNNIFDIVWKYSTSNYTDDAKGLCWCLWNWQPKTKRRKKAEEWKK